MQAAEKKGIKRYIMLSARHSLEPEKWHTIVDYYTAKHFADLYLMKLAQLDYTIVQPGHLMADEGNGKISINEDEMDTKGNVSIKSVADVLKEVLDKTNTYGKCIPMLDGNILIAEAVSQV